MKELKKFVTITIGNNEELREEILELYQLCLDEIENGESEQNEIELCYSSIKELIDEQK